MAQKRDRLVAGVAELAAAVGADPPTRAAADHAARLAKADQGAVLVAEFSELEGYVAAEYARREGVPDEVATAVEEHYLPEGADSPLPGTAAGALLAAAERIDNLVGAFAVDEAPTGSKDPYGLRRAALGLVRIALDRGWDLDLRPLLQAAYGRLSAQGAELSVPADEAAAAVQAFLADRFVYLLGEDGVGAEAAAAAIGAGLGGLTTTAAWARAIQSARGGAPFIAVWTASTRLNRLARKGAADEAPIAPGDDPGEAALRSAVEAAAAPIDAAARAGRLRRGAGGGRAAGERRGPLLRGRARQRRRPRGERAAVCAGAGGGRGPVPGCGLRTGDRRGGSTVSSTGVITKRVYDFSEGGREMRDLLGGKGANVAEMTRLGLPVPKGFTITTETCIEYLRADHTFPVGLTREVTAHLDALEQAVGKRLGDDQNPLLVSVRSGAKFSMPGMMDTVLNLGLNDVSVEALAARTGNPRFAYDSYRRFIQMFGDVVAEVPKEHFEKALAAMKLRRRVEQDVRPLGRRPAQPGRDLQGHLPRAPWRALPAGAPRAAGRRDPRGVRVVGQPARPRLPPPQPHRP